MKMLSTTLSLLLMMTGIGYAQMAAEHPPQRETSTQAPKQKKNKQRKAAASSMKKGNKDDILMPKESPIGGSTGTGSTR